MATIHLLDEFAYPAPPTQAGKAVVPKVFLSDLPDVIPLCTRNIERWRNQHDGTDRGTRVDVDVIPLAWGDLDMGDQLARRLASEKRCLSHVLLIDLVSYISFRRLSLHLLIGKLSTGLFPTLVSVTPTNATASNNAALFLRERYIKPAGRRSRSRLVL